MFGRFRRARVLLAVLVFVLLVLFYGRQSPEESYETITDKVVGGGAVLRKPNDAPAVPQRPPPPVEEPRVEQLSKPTPKAQDVKAKESPATTAKDVLDPEPTYSRTSKSSSTSTSTRIRPINEHQRPPVNNDEIPLFVDSNDRFKYERPTSTSIAHWSKYEEQFPVTSTIQLPTEQPTPLRRIQYTGRIEADQERLAKIKEEAEHAWGGYRKYAFGADELTPITGSKKNPFNGWGATLVDSLDTLWIMGMKAEFEDAVSIVGSIDFTTSTNPTIPVFETTIRYMGGLLGAYDVSGRKHAVLLQKAVELGELLHAAFDTPNRMPETYYLWKPAFATQVHRASSRVVLAELGSLSVEMTRLAQLTGEPKYYDDVARITNALEEFQNKTQIPGMWPTAVDSSGCEKPAKVPYTYTYSRPEHDMPHNGEVFEAPSKPGNPKDQYLHGGEDADSTPHHSQYNLDESLAKVEAGLGKIKGFGGSNADEAIDEAIDSYRNKDSSRQKYPTQDHKMPAKEPSVKKIPGFNAPIDAKDLNSGSIKDKETFSSKVKRQSYQQTGQDVCIEAGLQSPNQKGQDTFTLGGQSDSTYEYLPKQYMLLGGVVDQYRTMYLDSAKAEIEKLLFRPMTPDNLDILISGEMKTNYNYTTQSYDEKFYSKGEHLTCFAGGMFAMGGKLFDRPGDVDIGRKLTEGCIWAYNSTATGIMPEGFTAMSCEDRYDCPWNQTAYWAVLDPYADQRAQAAEAMKIADAVPPRPPKNESPGRIAKDSEYKRSTKRDIDHGEDGAPVAPSPPKSTSTKAAYSPKIPTDIPSVPVPGYRAHHDYYPVGSASAPRPQTTPLSHEDFVKHKITSEGLPAGMTAISGRNYILRPEAIESVFYMYRITGEPYWREAGWNMFQAIIKHTRAEYGHAVLNDVTKKLDDYDDPKVIKKAQRDSMESFWLAETLKYFYLLFEDGDKWSLDEWVLNTEAHFLRRPETSIPR